MVRRWSLPGTVLALCVGCQGAPTVVRIAVDSDLGVPAELDRIELSIVGGGFATRTATANLGGASDPDLPRTLAVQYSSMGSLGPYTARATGFSGSTEVVSAEADFTFVQGAETTLEIFLARSCAGVSCPPAEVCVGGRCVPRARPDAGVDGAVGPPDSGFDAGERLPPVAPCDRACDMCGALCTDTRIDELNCGSCGVVCAATEVCDESVCARCALTMCGGECVSTASDDGHCGGCGAPCAADQSCSGGTCVPAQIGARCAVPVDVTAGTYALAAGAGGDIVLRTELVDGGYVPRCHQGALVRAVAVRFVAPSTGTLQMMLTTAMNTTVSFEVFADGDDRCECALPGACAWAPTTRTASASQSVEAGVGYRIVVGVTPSRDATLTLTMM